jgi:hypothetical protein
MRMSIYIKIGALLVFGLCVASTAYGIYRWYKDPPGGGGTDNDEDGYQDY